MLTQDNYMKAKLVETGFRYMTFYGCGHLGGQMVMHTLANRVRAGWGNWLKVVETIPTFAAETVPPEIVYPALWEPSFVKLLHAVEGIYSGSNTDLSHGALYWGDLGRIERDWFKEKIIQARELDPNDCEVPRHKRVADMNSLSFWT